VHPSIIPYIQAPIGPLSKIIYKGGVFLRHYIEDCCKESVDDDITKGTLYRIFNMVMDGSGKLRGKRSKNGVAVEDPEMDRIKKSFERHRKILDKIPLPYFDAAGRPIDNFMNVFIENIKTDVIRNFEKRQFAYIKATFIEYFAQDCFTEYPNEVLEEPLRAKQINYLARMLQMALNDSVKPLASNSQLISSELFGRIVAHLKIILCLLQTEMPKRLIDNKLHDSKLKKNHMAAIRYFAHIGKYLEKRGWKSFSPIPLTCLKRQHISFDKHFLCVVYNNWQRSLLKTQAKRDAYKGPSIDEFKKNHEPYYKKMFDFESIYDSSKRPSPITFLTNGVTVSVTIPTVADIGKTRTQKKKERADKSFLKKKAKKTPVAKRSPIVNLDEVQLKTGLLECANTRCSVNTYYDKYDRIGIDPGNNNLLCVVKDGEKPLMITKAAYNEASHITRNKKKMENLKKKDTKIMKIYRDLSETQRKTASIEMYTQYLEVVIANWDKLWSFQLNPSIAKMRYDTFWHSRKEVAKICRKVIGDTKNPLIAFGKGNGSMTISNTKNSSAHGPVKRIAKALSKVALVLLTDENNTSKVCSGCTDDWVFYPYTHHHVPYKRLVKRVLGRAAKDAEDYKDCLKKHHIAELQKENIDIRRSIGLCCCQNKTPLRVHNRWSRDHNSGRNMIEVMRRLLMGLDLGLFSRKKKDTPNAGKRSMASNIIVYEI
jgi:hypothetical protein